MHALRFLATTDWGNDDDDGGDGARPARVGGGEEGDGRSAVIERTSALRSAVAADGHGRGRGSLFVRTSEWTMNVAAWRYRVNFLEQQRRLEIISGSENP